MQSAFRLEIIGGLGVLDSIADDFSDAIGRAGYELIKQDGPVSWYEPVYDFTEFHMTATMIGRLAGFGVIVGIGPFPR
jgi:hypothetical protein